MEISNLLNKEFKVMMVRQLNELRRRISEHGEEINKYLDNIKKNKTVKKSITEIKYTLERIQIRLDDTEEWISELEYR